MSQALDPNSIPVGTLDLLYTQESFCERDSPDWEEWVVGWWRVPGGAAITDTVVNAVTSTEGEESVHRAVASALDVIVAARRATVSFAKIVQDETTSDATLKLPNGDNDISNDEVEVDPMDIDLEEDSPVPFRWNRNVALMPDNSLQENASDGPRASNAWAWFRCRISFFPDDVYLRERPKVMVCQRNGGVKPLSRTSLDYVVRWIFERLNVDPKVWSSTSGPPRPVETGRGPIPQEKEIRLIHLYNRLPSPRPNFFSSGDTDIDYLLEECLVDGLQEEMRTVLYNYQRRSVWKMLRKELCPERILDPRLIQCKAAGDQQVYYYAPSQQLVFQDPVYYDDSRGGIICEDMGTGKTLLCLFLTLYTRHQMVSVSSLPATVSIQCSLSDLKYDPTWHPEPVWQHSLLQAQQLTSTTKVPVPSLRLLAACAIQRYGISYREYADRIPSTLFDLMEDHPAWYLPVEAVPIRGDRRRSGGGNEDVVEGSEIYISRTTLVIVPDTLVDQWVSEIHKHICDDVLRHLIIRGTAGPDSVIPSPKDLIKYDMVLMSQGRFSSEEKKKSYNAPCRCTYAGRSRQVLCECPPRTLHVSSLRQVHWKRIIVDEGHVMAADSTNRARLLASRLHAERRWICTGTPTQNLIVTRGLQTDQVGAISSTSAALVAAQAEEADLRRLGSLFAFLRAEPFTTHGTWQAQVAKPFLDSHQGSRSRLMRILGSALVRNRPEDREREVRLPPCEEKVAIVEFSEAQRLTHNVMIANFCANAVLSERCDKDYYFHPANAKYLRGLVTNLLDSCTYYAGGDMVSEGSLRSTYRNIDEALSSRHKHYSPCDIQLLESSKNAITSALENRLWGTMAARLNAVYVVKGLNDPQIATTWSWAMEGDETNVEGKCLVLAEEIEYLRWATNGLGDDEEIPGITTGRRNSTSRKKEEDGTCTGQKRKRTREDGESGTGKRSVNNCASASPSSSSGPSSATRTMCDGSLEIIAADTSDCGSKSFAPRLACSQYRDERDETVTDDVSVSAQRKACVFALEHAGPASVAAPCKSSGSVRPGVVFAPTTRPPTSESESDRGSDGSHSVEPNPVNPIHTLGGLRGAAIVATASAKISYLIPKVIRHALEGEKTIVFCNQTIEFYYVEEALRLALHRIGRVLSFRGGRDMTSAQRSSNITTFNTGAHVACMVMDVRTAAYGIDLSSASRIYFVSPVFEPARERQAIKRAHRIGQIRPVFVETLVARGTIEEAMVDRKREIGEGKGKEATATKMSLVEDSKMRTLLTEMKFLPPRWPGPPTSSTMDNVCSLLETWIPLFPEKR